MSRPSVALALAGLALYAGCGRGRDEPFEEVASRAGLAFEHVAGERGEYLLPEIIGAGAALIDYDGDGDLDAFLVQGGAVVGTAAATPQGAEQAPAGHRLFRNELVPSGELRFTDVTSAAGLADSGYGMGAATADIDGDGDWDLLVTEFGRNRLYRNEGGRFTEIAQDAGVADGGWGTSAAFCDYDRDGDADLYVAHYVRFDPAQNRTCTGTTGHRDYCSPEAYPPEPDGLFRNEGGGRFSDASAQSGVAARAAAGLGVVCADFDGDGLPDFYVANDRTADFFWHNAGGGQLEEQGVVRGAAYDGAGKAEASMGIAVGDFDGDADDDLFVTTYDPETNTLRENDGKGYFLDVTDRLGLGLPSLSYTGWGTGWIDVDNDGVEELFVANGAILEVESRRGRSPRPYEQLNQLFRRTADGRFAVEPGRGALGLLENSRGAAFGDVDNDGDIDVLVTNNDGPARLLLTHARGHWLGLQLDGIGAAATGARVMVKRAGAAPLVRYVHTDGSYLSASDPRLQFGLGAKSGVDDVLVEWPDGRHERWRGLEADRYHVLREGEGSTSP